MVAVPGALSAFKATFDLHRVLRRTLLAATASLCLVLPLDGRIMPFAGGLAHAQDAAEEPPDAPPDDVAPDALQPGEAVVTRFSGLVDGADDKGNPIKVIDVEGVSASFIDVQALPEPPYGQHWIDEPQRVFVTADEVGQVFGVTLADTASGAPDVYLAATAAFGLHHDPGPGPRDWMAGMWGPDGGPGTIWRLSAANGYKPEKFADVMLDGRPNTGAALGNLAYDKLHGLIFVSDMETGMITALDTATGEQRFAWDHGVDGRANFLDVATGEQMALDPVQFDPNSTALVDDCKGKFDISPNCWNIADFRRRVWGLDVRIQDDGTARLFYSVWGSDALGNPEWDQAGDDRFNAVWSVALGDDGTPDPESVRREFLMPAFWPGDPAFGKKAELSNPVSDITFPQCEPADVMLLSERGGMRNLGLSKKEPFAKAHESRVLRFEANDDESWSPVGRYDVGFLNHETLLGAPSIFANASGGADFGLALETPADDAAVEGPQSVWMTGDSLCSPLGKCSDKARGVDSDPSEVHGVQGTPFDALTTVEPSIATDFLYRSVMIDTDINVDGNGNPVPEEMTRNDATKIGDVAIYLTCEAVPEQPTETIVPPDEGWPVHTLNMSHQKWASVGHRVDRSWHRRDGSWHTVGRSWHWRDGSWHYNNRSWHWRRGSWHTANRSWHWRQGSWHTANRSWHWRQGSWHTANRSWHWRKGSWHNIGKSWHLKPRSWHTRARSWDGGHTKNRSWHNRNRSWDSGHFKNRSWHNKGRSWKDGNQPVHVKGKSWHNKGRSWKDGTHTLHNKKLSRNKDHPVHNKRLSKQSDNHPVHTKKASRNQANPVHNKRLSRQSDNHPVHAKKASRNQNQPVHAKKASRNQNQPVHAKKASRNQNQPVHAKKASRNQNQPVHAKKASRNQNQPVHSKRASNRDHSHQDPVHGKRLSNQQSNKKQNVHSRRQSRADQGQHSQQQVHKKRLSNQQTQGTTGKHRRKLSQMQGQ